MYHTLLQVSKQQVMVETTRLKEINTLVELASNRIKNAQTPKEIEIRGNILAMQIQNAGLIFGDIETPEGQEYLRANILPRAKELGEPEYIKLVEYINIHPNKQPPPHLFQEIKWENPVEFNAKDMNTAMYHMAQGMNNEDERENFFSADPYATAEKWDIYQNENFEHNIYPQNTQINIPRESLVIVPLRTLKASTPTQFFWNKYKMYYSLKFLHFLKELILEAKQIDRKYYLHTQQTLKS